MTGQHWNLLAGALAVSILNIPQLTTVTEDAMQGVPELYREGSLGLGATHWQTITGVLLPAALPRIITGIIMAAGRGFGEAAALLFTSGMSSDVNFNNWNPFSLNSPLNAMRPADTLAVRIWALKTEGVDAERHAAFRPLRRRTDADGFRVQSWLPENRHQTGRKADRREP